MTRGKLLYVEDNEDNVFMLSKRLRREGYEVLVARDGEQGLAQAQAVRPDLILMDLGLPVIDGWEVTRRLKAGPDTRDIPIIAVSAFAMADERARAVQAGADDFVEKPIDFAVLLGKIEQWRNTTTI